MSGESFQVDLRGVVDLLARHLYSSPRVYLRELLQNGVDAITARRALAEGAPERIDLRPLPGGGLEVCDTGIGLTAADARELLATIGRSSKRDADLGGGREEFLGQFGIGLLSAFMVADEIDLVSRCARPGPEGQRSPAIRWRGFTDGRYELTELADDDPAIAVLEGAPGSAVRLVPRRDAEHWLAPDMVAALAEDFGGLLPVDVALEVRLDDGSLARRRLSGDELPWRVAYPNDAARTVALASYSERALGFTPLASIDVEIPIAGLTGVAFVLPAAVAPTTVAHHRVYLKRMLLSSGVTQVLPPWAFFVRCVLDASGLRPTASREGLYEDDLLLAAREALGERVRAWVLDTLTAGGPVARRFVEVHHLALRALALVDDEVLDLAVTTLPFESTVGAGTLRELAERAGDARLLFTRSLEEYRRIAAVAAHKGIVVVNGGYVYDADLLERAAARHRELGLAAAVADDIARTLDELEPVRELEILDAVVALRATLADQDCDILVRRYDPPELSAVLIDDRDGEHARAAHAEAATSDDVWGEILTGLTEPARPRRLILNDASATVRALLATRDGDVRDAATRSLYVTTVLASGLPLQTAEVTLMNESLSLLMERALGGDSTSTKDDR
ncbi:HSP90 family protein [Propioniciclava flava]|uniref:HSP90 family protein n=1 Tax=Propioniciclava flava TaxID=2072026 RepID=A0A4Q2ED85_9ACTN|nr:HSP90 family protein [Propioniciclava flava]RXW31397.1 HSP90 family protein [Propioniciclava flava]